jgi:iron complex outermembrane receptor protein
MTGSFTWFQMDLSRDAGSNDNGFESGAGNDPEFQWQLHSHWDLPHHFEFDSFFYYVDSVDSLNVQEYTRLDLRLGWNPIKNLELSIIGQNLLDPDHPEFATETLATGTATNPERSIFGKALWKF